MNMNWTGALVVAVSSLAIFGCGNEPVETTIAPALVGERGEKCEARNDCKSGLACIAGATGGICSKNDFDIVVAAKASAHATTTSTPNASMMTD